MVNITKVYTRTGDKGETSIAGNHRFSKNSTRIEAIGCIDELNAYLGWVLVEVKHTEHTSDIFSSKLYRIQQTLFNLGAALAVLPEDRRDNTPGVSQSDIDCLEQEIDQMNEKLPKLTSFILPGGGEIGARLHVARTICRRAERRLITLNDTESLDPELIPYINRLSDWLFVAARYAAQLFNEPEVLWV